MLVMTFAHKGIEQLRRHQEHVTMRNPDGEFVVSPGFDDGKQKLRTPLNSGSPFFSVDLVSGAIFPL
jgi:hypothetical protein